MKTTLWDRSWQNVWSSPASSSGAKHAPASQFTYKSVHQQFRNEQLRNGSTATAYKLLLRVFSCGCSNAGMVDSKRANKQLQKLHTIREVRRGAVCVPRAAWPPSALQNQDAFAPQLLPLQHMENRMGGSERSAAAMTGVMAQTARPQDMVSKLYLHRVLPRHVTGVRLACSQWRRNNKKTATALDSRK